VFTGAGISTESGIPDFRSANGIYSEGRYKGHSPQAILSQRFFRKDKELFFSYYKERLHSLLTKKPNRSHYAIVKLEQLGKIKAVITQNIDNLHESAGSKRVYDLHGNGSQSYCISCQEQYTYDQFSALMDLNPIPRCSCGGIVRPNTVLFDEALNDNVFDEAYWEVKKCDLLISIGSSLVVEPAAGMVRELLPPAKLVIINQTPTLYDKMADLVIRENCGEVLEQLVKDYETLLSNNVS
jgi:NAD-dependent deacetylase